MKNLLIFIFAFCCGIWTCKMWYGSLTFYGGDIFYVDVNRLHVGTESGSIDTTFNSFMEMSEFLENESALSWKVAADYDLETSLLNGKAEILPGGLGVRVRAGSFVILLNRTDDGRIFYNED